MVMERITIEVADAHMFEQDWRDVLRLQRELNEMLGSGLDVSADEAKAACDKLDIAALRLAQQIKAITK